MTWGRSRIREQDIDAFSTWLDDVIGTRGPMAADEYLFELLNAPECGGIGRRAREMVASLPGGVAVSVATVATLIDRLDRELASECFSRSARRVKQRLDAS